MVIEIKIKFNSDNNSNEREYNKEINKPQDRKVLHDAIAHDPLTDAQLVPEH